MNIEFTNLNKILANQNDDLKSLCQASGLDIFDFFQGADLQGLDLTGQDLTGMNFDDADLSGAILNRVKFDLGAFNNAKVPARFRTLTDDCYLSLFDLAESETSILHLFYAFRNLTFSQIRKGAKVSFEEMARESGVSSRTIRKADSSGIISYSTAIKLSKYITRQKIDFNSDRFKTLVPESRYVYRQGQRIKALSPDLNLYRRAKYAPRSRHYLPLPRISLRQPCAIAIELHPTRGFEFVSRDDFIAYRDVAAEYVGFLAENQLMGPAALLSPSAIRKVLSLD